MRIAAKQLIEFFPGPHGHQKDFYRAVLCTQPGKPTVVFLCEPPGSNATSVSTVAPKLRAQLQADDGLAEDTIFFSVDRNCPQHFASKATDGVLVLRLTFNEAGLPALGDVTTLAAVAEKHDISLEPLKQSCLVFPGAQVRTA